MKRLVRFLFWSLVFLALLIGTDQFLRRARLESPAFRDFQTFYLDLSRRVGAIAFDRTSPNREEPTKTPARGGTKPAAESPRYFYVDRDGELQFADSLEEIPPAFRGEAHPLSP